MPPWLKRTAGGLADPASGLAFTLALAALAVPTGWAVAGSETDETQPQPVQPLPAQPLTAQPPPALPAADTPTRFAAAFEPLGAPSLVTAPAPGAVDIARLAPPRGARLLRSLGSGTASFYGRRFHGRRTASGERFDMNAMTAAHKTLPFGTRVRVTNPRNGRSVTVRINDRGPFVPGRTIDLSQAAARKLGIIQRGHARVKLEIVAP